MPHREAKNWQGEYLVKSKSSLIKLKRKQREINLMFHVLSESFGRNKLCLQREKKMLIIK